MTFARNFVVENSLDLAAQDEIRQAALFYEESRKGLGLEFLKAVEAAFNHFDNIPQFGAS